MSFKDDVKINRNTLDKNAIDQVDLYEEYGNQWADAVDERDRAKEALSLVKTQIDEEIRDNPDKFGWDNNSKSPTETWIANKIIGDDRYQKATDELLDAQKEVNRMVIAKETLEHRKKMIEILVDLYKGNYFVGISHNETLYREGVSKEAAKTQNERLKQNERMERRRKA